MGKFSDLDHCVVLDISAIIPQQLVAACCYVEGKFEIGLYQTGDNQKIDEFLVFFQVLLLMLMER